jgi:hypothetical protein
MDYSGPVAADYANIRSLNTTFLKMLRASVEGRRLRRFLPEPTREQILAMTDLQLERLATCPFLLMSFRESDRAYWQAAVADTPAGDLLASEPVTALERLATAGLAFLWQLAQRNPYAARLVSGGNAEFCGSLTETTLIRLLHRMAGRDDQLRPRFAGNAAAWSKLLEFGISPTPQVRAAAQLSVLHGMLTAPAPGGEQRLRAAACKTALPARRIADKPAQR